jgi:hypothetical protein
VSFVSGLTALNLDVRKDGRWTAFGLCLGSAVVLGAVLSIAGVLVEQSIKKRSDDETASRFVRLQHSADAQRYSTNNATGSFTLAMDKHSPLLARVLPSLDSALAYAKARCMQPGGVVQCGDYVIRDVIIEEIRFDQHSRLYRQLLADRRLARIVTKAGVVVRLHPVGEPIEEEEEEEEVYNAVLLSPSTRDSILFEYDGHALRWFVDEKMPADAFERAGVPSLVDLENRSGTARAYAMSGDFCPRIRDDECERILLQLLRALHLEDASFEFPHGRSISFVGAEKRPGSFGIPYLYMKFPSSVEQFPRNP